ncbi:MAG: ABC-F family ATP-binding cassette domain-containing protein [Abitibacteriaceae bacterium]|nr:ABC-F family ATP-binding cassette domain-containing protein [Abditibacteriaceae bacterium]
MLTLENVSKQFGPQIILQDADLFITPEDRVGLVGPNGAGKTTLLKLIAGLETPDRGNIRLDAYQTVGVLSQESQCRLGISVREEMYSAFPEADEAQQEIEALAERLSDGVGSNGDYSFDHRETLRQLSNAQTTLEMQETHTMEARIGRVLHGLGFADNALDRLTDEFSGGWQMRIAMAKLLLRQPDLLLLDEPTNHLDVAARKWLQGYLEEYPGAVLIVSHDPRFLDATVERIVELEDGKLNTYTGNYGQYQRQKQEMRERQVLAYERQQRELERQQEFMDRFGAKASKASQVKSREKQLDKIEKIEAPKGPAAKITFQFPEAPRSAQDVLKLRGVSKLYGDDIVLLDINLTLKRGDRIALLGPNGAGKSTLLRLIAGLEPPSEGTREEGRNVLLGYFAQHQAEALDPSRTALQEVLHGLASQPEGLARSLLGRLLLRGNDVFKPISVLSGGERSRVALAKFLMRPANLLLLDEPTNHLDPASRAVLQDALSTFTGTIVVASHDRPFINAVATEAYTVQDGTLIEQREPLVPVGKGGKKK